MPITFACPGCGGRLRVPDEAAGKKVSCPACKGVHIAPPPADVPPPAPVVAAPPPPPPAPPAGSAANPWSFDDEAGGAGEPAPLVRSSASQSGERRGRGRRDESQGDKERAGPARGKWTGFGAGCRLAALGTWVEFAAVAAFLGPLLVIAVSAAAGSVWWQPLVSKAGPFAVLPFFGLMLLGAGLVAVGRVRMCAVPPGTGARGVLFGTLVLSAVRVLGVAAGTGMVVLSGLQFLSNTTDGTTAYLLYALGGYAVAFVAGVVADVTVLPGLAVVGGAIPNAALRRRAGTAAFLFQLVALVSVLQVAALYLILLSTPALANRVPGSPRPAPTPTTRPNTIDSGGSPAAAAVVAFGVIVFMLLCQAGYAGLYAGLYATGRKAAADGAPRD